MQLESISLTERNSRQLLSDRCCIAIVTNERALLSGSDQPVQNLGCRRILYVRRENKRSKTATFAQWYMVHC